MMLLKRLLLPGKGDVILCIFLLINVLLLWCGGESVSSVRCATSIDVGITSPIKLITSFLLYNSRVCGVVLVTCYFVVSLQFPRSSAEAVLISQDQTQKPVLNKTDPLAIMLAVSRHKGGERISSSIRGFDDNNYGKRRRPVYISRSSSSNSSRDSTASNVFLNTTNSDRLSWRGGGGSQSSHNSNNSSGKLIRRTTTLRRHSVHSDGGSRSSNLTVVTSKKRKGRTRTISNSDQSKNHRKPKLLKEITLLNRQNCLAKLLCGVQVAQPPTKSSSALNDYAYLVKAFFDRFSIRGIVTDVVDAAFAMEQDRLDDEEEEDDEDEDDIDESSDRKKKRKKRPSLPYAGAQFHRARRPPYEKYEPKYYEEYDRFLDEIEYETTVDDNVPDFMEPDLLRKRSGRNLTVHECNGTGGGRGVIHRTSKMVPVDINRIRRRRGIQGEVKRGFMGFYNPRFDKTAYLNKRQLDLISTENQAKQLNIAEEIAARLRSPRQCRLLSWFGNTGTTNQNTQSAPQNGMTTTITTITNTGGMVGNMNGMQNIPQQAASAAAGGGSMNNPGSQVVTVIQQSPVTPPTQPPTPFTAPGQSSATAAKETVAKAAASASSMLKDMGQKASDAMAEASSVASHIGSTICPFTIPELQDLILKAQTAPFPHFLTTTRPAQNFIPGLPIAQKNPQLPPRFPPHPPPPRAKPNPPPTPPPPPPPPPPTRKTTTTVATTTIKVTQAPPPPSTTVAVIVSRNPPPPSSRLDPSTFAQLYSNYDQVMNQHQNPPHLQRGTPPPSHSHYQHNTPPPNHFHHGTPPSYNQPLHYQQSNSHYHNDQPQIPHFQHATPPTSRPQYHNRPQYHRPTPRPQYHPPPQPSPLYLHHDEPTHPPSNQYSMNDNHHHHNHNDNYNDNNQNHDIQSRTPSPPIFPPAPVVFPPYPSKESSDPDHQTRRPDEVPSIGMAGEDDEGEFEDEPYVTYENKNSHAQPPKKKAKPTPKWMTTTTPSPEDDELFSYNDADPIPNYSYTKPLHQPQQQEQPIQVQTYKVGTQKVKDPIEVQNYIREFQQPPVVVDSNSVYRPGTGTGLVPYHATHPNDPLPQTQAQQPAPTRPPGRTPTPNRKVQPRRPLPTPKPKKKPSSDSEEDDEDGSDEDNSGSSEDSNDDEEEDEEGSDEESSGSGESRAKMMKQTQNPVQSSNKRPSPPTRSRLPTPSPASSSVEGSEEEESNEAEESKDTAEDEEEGEDGDSEEDDEDGDGKRSYERTNFSKDRVGSPAGSEPTTTKKPTINRKPTQQTTSKNPSRFFSNFFNSISSFTSYFNKDDAKKKEKSSFGNYFMKRMSSQKPKVSPKPPVKYVESSESDEESYDDDYEESEEDSPEQAKQTNPPQRKSKNSASKSIITSLISSWIQPKPIVTTTRAPVLLEELGNWAKTFIRSKLGNQAISQEDDSGEEDLPKNPIQMFNEALQKGKRQKYKGFFSGFSLSSDESNDEDWLSNNLHGGTMRSGKALKKTAKPKPLIRTTVESGPPAGVP